MPARRSSGRERARSLARSISSSLAGVDSKTALKALFDAIVVVASRLPVEERAPLESHGVAGQLLRRGRGRSFRVAADPQLQAYVHELDGYHTIDQIVSKCRRKFGARRTPSRSSIARYLRSLRMQTTMTRKGRI